MEYVSFHFLFSLCLPWPVKTFLIRTFRYFLHFLNNIYLYSVQITILLSIRVSSSSGGPHPMLNTFSFNMSWNSKFYFLILCPRNFQMSFSHSLFFLKLSRWSVSFCRIFPLLNLLRDHHHRFFLLL